MLEMVTKVNGFMWGIGLLLLLCGTGIYFTIRLRFIQVRRFGEGIRLVFFGLFSTGRDATGALTFGFNTASMGNMLFRAMPLILT